ncbi:HlyD family efflux transporter periplasmic adaptor subunit [Variovorax sp. CAN2819]|nr:HlyD family efflux transporter periplasmic adaptor subunit [Variovorax sp. CAN15]MDN6887283.1 HlyD family efflux transporter periplasmic adaptor subunit [Variovorax sp. CAN15]
MDSSLFRQEVLAQNSSYIGTVRLYSPPYRWLIVGVIASSAIATIFLLFWGTYTKRERLIGQILPSKGLVSLTLPISGSIAAVHVREGMLVDIDQDLLTISAELETGLGSTRQLINEQLKLQRSKLKADLEGQIQLNQEIQHGLNQRLETTKNQLAQIELQHKQRARQNQLAKNQLSKLQEMQSQGYVSISQVEQQETTVLDAQARLQDLLRLRLETVQQLKQLYQQQRELPLNARSQENVITRKLAEIDQSIAENESRRSVILRAPQPSMVAAVLAKPGQFSSAGQTVLSLLPQSATLEAQLMVPSRAIGFIRNGKKVVLRYQAYPYQKFGQHHGRVSEVSRTALSPQEVMQLTGRSDIREQHYRVVVALDRDDITVYGKPEKLRPGMALEADVLLDKRRLIEWIFEPLHALGQRTNL